MSTDIILSTPDPPVAEAPPPAPPEAAPATPEPLAAQGPAKACSFLGVRKGERTDWPEKFLTAFASLGNVARACQKTRVGRRTAYDRREADPEFAARWDEVIRIADETMEGEARRRAVEGTLVPVYQSGKLVGKVREYSDTLLIFLLKAHNPSKYRDNAKVVIAGDPAAPLKQEHSGTVTHEHSFPDPAAVVAFLGDLGLPCPDALPADGGG